MSTPNCPIEYDHCINHGDDCDSSIKPTSETFTPVTDANKRTVNGIEIVVDYSVCVKIERELNEIKADLSIAREVNNLLATRVKNPLIAENNQLREVAEELAHNIQLMTMFTGKDAVIKILTKWNKLNSNLQRCK